MSKRLASTDPETVSGFRQTISCLKDHLGTLGYGVGPVVGLLAALVVGFFNPQAFDNDYFVILILFFGIFWMLFYGGGPLKNDDVDTTTIKSLKPLTLRSETKSGENLNRCPKIGADLNSDQPRTSTPIGQQNWRLATTFTRSSQNCQWSLLYKKDQAIKATKTKIKSARQTANLALRLAIRIRLFLSSLKASSCSSARARSANSS
jgi:hypothetical protein